MAVVPTTGWGMAYMLTLLVTMLLSFGLSKTRRTFALTLVLLWVATRLSLLLDDLYIAYQATALAYIAGTLYVLFAQKITPHSAILAFCLILIAATGTVAYLIRLPLDPASILYELFGVFAMITIIIGPDPNGTLRHIRRNYQKNRSRLLAYRVRNSVAGAAAKKRD